MPAKLFFLVLLALTSDLSAAAANDVEARLAFNDHCRTCHSARKGDNRLGPSLYGIIGRPAGQVVGYHGYSGGLSGFVWDVVMLDRLIADPTSVSSGTTMIFPPVRDASVRKKIISFLRTLDER